MNDGSTDTAIVISVSNQIKKDRFNLIPVELVQILDDYSEKDIIQSSIESFKTLLEMNNYGTIY